jgi:hypothetical protein
MVLITLVQTVSLKMALITSVQTALLKMALTILVQTASANTSPAFPQPGFCRA